MKWRRIAALVLTSAMMVSMTACGGGENDTGDTVTQEEEGSGTEESDGGETKDSIVITTITDPTTLAPNGQSGDGWTYAQMYDQLWNLTDGELVMRVGTGYEQEDDTHYLITIQSGITDTAGNELTASDVLFSIELAKNGSAGYPGATRFIDVENCEVVDDTTLRVALTEPCSF